MYNFNKDIKEGLEKYPSLKLISPRLIEGTFSSFQKETGIVIDDYRLIIQFPDNYPYVFPNVNETSGKIPKTVMRHVFSITGNLCFGNFFDTKQVCKNGISFLYFLEEILNPHLCREYVRQETGIYPTGEREHDFEGQWSSFYEIVGTKDKEAVLIEINRALSIDSCLRNDLCFCNSSKKYKNCHLKIKNSLLEIGDENLQFAYELLKKNYQN